jgi:hypothetical protein
MQPETKKFPVLSRYSDVNCTFHAFVAVWTAWITVVLRSWLQQYCRPSVSSSVHMRSILYSLQRRGSGVARAGRVMLPPQAVQCREDSKMNILNWNIWLAMLTKLYTVEAHKMKDNKWLRIYYFIYKRTFTYSEWTKRWATIPPLR